LNLLDLDEAIQLMQTEMTKFIMKMPNLEFRLVEQDVGIGVWRSQNQHNRIRRAWDKVPVGEGVSADSARMPAILLIHTDVSR
jgi:hypothetical protein